MIVNTAYSYMGKNHSPAVLPLWSNGEINTEHNFDAVYFDSAKNTLTITNTKYGGFAQFKNIDCTKFTQLKFSATSTNITAGRLSVRLRSSSNTVLSTTQVIIPKQNSTAGEFIVEIPESAKTAGITIEFSPDSNTAGAILFYAELS